MFRVEPADFRSSLRVSAGLTLTLLVLAWGAGLGSAVIASTESTARRGILLSVILLALGIVAFIWLWVRFHVEQIALRKVKLLARDILASMDHGVITVDTAGIVTSLNSGALRLLTVELEAVGRPIRELARPEMPLDRLSGDVISNHKSTRDREYQVETDGQSRRLLVSAHELKDIQGQPLGSVIHVRDITNRMRMKEQVWRLERLASVSTLAAGLHHEIKNPLTALSLHVQLLEERLHERHASESVDDLIGVVKSEVRRLNGVLENFRGFASLDQVRLEPTNLVELLERIARLMGPQAESQRVAIAIEQPGRPLPLVPVDAAKIHEAVLNLVVNALEAMTNGGRLTLAPTFFDGSFVIDVRDTGHGIPEQIRADLFKPYVSTKSRGSGIGLALTEKLVSQHRGQVTFQTSEEGTTFRVILPLAAEASEGEGSLDA